MVPLKNTVGRYDRTVIEFNINEVITRNGDIVPVFNNIEGEVENVLNPRHAILKFEYENQIYRALCSYEDVFVFDFSNDFDPSKFAQENPFKFKSVQECWKFTAQEKGVSLHQILMKGNKYRMNVVPLITHYPNPAEVHYTTAGLVAGLKAQDCPAPIRCPEAVVFDFPYNKNFNLVTMSLNSEGNLSGSTLNEKQGKRAKITASMKSNNKCF